MGDPLVQVGDIWRDLDPRGGPRFRVVEVYDPLAVPRRAVVEGLDGKRRRSVLLSRFRSSDTYRSGYTLVSRSGSPATEEGPTDG